MIAAQQDFNNAFIAGLLPRTFESEFISGFLPREAKPKLTPVSKDKESNVAPGIRTINIKVGETVEMGRKGEKQYRITLEEFNKDVLILRTIDVSHGVGCVVIKKQYIATTKKEIQTTVNQLTY